MSLSDVASRGVKLVVPSVRVRWRPATGSLLAFWLPLALYLAVAWLLVLTDGYIVGDAWSRVGNASYVLFSRDPHLAAIGFVWNPLPSLAMLPLLPLKAIWPPLVSAGFAANIVSALFMAGAVRVVSKTLVEAGLGARMTGLLALAFALHPMIVLYAANGMSEAPFLFFLVLAIQKLLAWWRTAETIQLASLGLALAGAYLTRYEAVAASLAAIGLVAGRTFVQHRSQGAAAARLAAASDALIAGAPFLAAFAAWALASWIIVGSPFDTFTSIYGNTSQTTLSADYIRAATGTGFAAVAYLVVQVLVLAPGLVLVGPAVILALARGRTGALVPIALLGSVLAFAAWALLTGKSFGWLRFSIAAVPLATLVAGLLLLPPRGRPRAVRSNRFLAWDVAGGAALAGVLLALPVAFLGMTDPLVGREEASPTSALMHPATAHSIETTEAVSYASNAARFIDQLGLPDGSVVVDVAIGFPIVLQSEHPREFVITTDRDFARTVADPTAFGARFLLVPSGQGYSGLDALSRAYPGLYATGAGIGEFVAQFGPSDGAYSWRLYALSAPVA